MSETEEKIHERLLDHPQQRIRDRNRGRARRHRQQCARAATRIRTERAPHSRIVAAARAASSRGTATRSGEAPTLGNASAASRARTGDLVDLDAVDVRPLVRRRDLPRYVARARRAGEQGTLDLALLIDVHGEVADVALIREDVGPDLVAESLSSARGWTFSPARKDRQAVKVWQQVQIEFTILPNRATSVRIRD